jgi:hypothetical protein
MASHLLKECSDRVAESNRQIWRLFSEEKTEKFVVPLPSAIKIPGKLNN